MVLARQPWPECRPGAAHRPREPGTQGVATMAEHPDAAVVRRLGEAFESGGMATAAAVLAITRTLSTFVSSL